MKYVLPTIIALALGSAAHSAPVQVFDPVRFQKTLEFEVEVERKGNDFEIEAELEYEARDADGKKIKDSKANTKAKRRADSGSPLAFELTLDGALAQYLVVLGGDPVLNGSVTMDPVSSFNLLEVELELKADKKAAPGASVVTLTDFSIGGSPLLLAAVSAPFLDDKGKAKDKAKARWFFGLPDQGLFGDMTIAGLIGLQGPWKEYELKLKLGQADSFTVPASAVAPIPLPAAGWMLLGAVAGLGAMRRAQSRPSRDKGEGWSGGSPTV